MSSKDHEFWTAAKDGNLSFVNALLASDPAINPNEDAVNVNWVGPEKNDTPLHRACRFGHFQVVEFLLKSPKVEVNAGNAGQATPFGIACQEGHVEVVKLLLVDPRIDVNKQE